MKVRKIMLGLILLSSTSCVSLRYSVPRLDRRSLAIQETEAKFIYNYRKCEKKSHYKKPKKWKKCPLVREIYDFNDPITRKMLKDKGFVLKKRDFVE